MKKKKSKERKPKKDFADRLAEKLNSLGDVTVGSLGDDSARWIDLRIGNKALCFSFDMKGEKLNSVGLWKDVVEVTDTKCVFKTKDLE